MGSWAYQGIELRPEEQQPETLLNRLTRLEWVYGQQGSFSAIGTFEAPIQGSSPPRFNPKGKLRRFLHVAWQGEDAVLWPLLYYLALRENRALLSSYSGVGFYARDIERDGHPREPVLIASFTNQANDFDTPLEPEQLDNAAWSRFQSETRDRLEAVARKLEQGGLPAGRIAEAASIVERRAIRFDTGWFLRDGTWFARYYLAGNGQPAVAIAQKSLCSSASRSPATLQVLMPSENCVHHLAARLAEELADFAIGSELADGYDPAGPK